MSLHKMTDAELLDSIAAQVQHLKRLVVETEVVNQKWAQLLMEANRRKVSIPRGVLEDCYMNIACEGTLQ